jgi:hypothetical protein
MDPATYAQDDRTTTYTQSENMGSNVKTTSFRAKSRNPTSLVVLYKVITWVLRLIRRMTELHHSQSGFAIQTERSCQSHPIIIQHGI